MNALGVCLLAYLCGLQSASFSTWPLWPLALALLPGLLLPLNPSRRSLWLLVVLCLVSGNLRYPLQLRPPQASADFFAAHEGEPLRMRAEIQAVQQQQSGGLNLDLKLLAVEADPEGYTRGAGVRLFVATSEQRPIPGQTLTFSSRIRRVRNFGVPGEFDYERHLAFRRIWYSAFLPDDRGLAVFAGAPGGAARARHAALGFVERLSNPDAGLLKALLLGEKGAISSDVRRTLAAGGISHLFAISGLHLGLLALLVYGVLRFAYARFAALLLWQPPSRILWLIVTVPLFFYLHLTGDALATRRAFFALLLVATLFLLRRRTDPLQLLACLAFLFLLIEPLALWQPSFLLSFSGAYGILIVHRATTERLRTFPICLRKPVQLLLACLAATLATQPFVALFFHLFSPAAVLVNLLAVPVVSLVALPLGLAGLFLAPVSTQGGLLLLRVSAWCLKKLLFLAEFVTSLPGLKAQNLFLTHVELLALFLFCLALLLGMRQRRALLLLIPALLLGGIAPVKVEGPKVTMFSVGQGEAILLQVRGKTILIDSGGLRSETFDVGERLLAPALGLLGVKRIDLMILTHNHPDHSGGFAYLVRQFPPEEFWTIPRRQGLPPALRQALDEGQVKRRIIRSPDWSRPGPASETGLWVRTGVDGASNENDASLCLYLATSAGGLLLTGDLEAAGVEGLLSSALPGPVALLKVPHHGSASSLPETYLAKLRPQIAMVSAGYANSYRFPSTEFLHNAQKFGVEVRRTDLEGTLGFRIVDGRWTGSHWDRGVFR